MTFESDGSVSKTVATELLATRTLDRVRAVLVPLRPNDVVVSSDNLGDHWATSHTV